MNNQVKNIGLITHYFKSTNYGGNFQAYALCALLNQFQNIHAEQICYIFQGYNQSKHKSLKEKLKGKTVFTLLKSLFNRIVGQISAKKKAKFLAFACEKRQVAFVDFNQNKIPHSEKVYNLSNISECVDDYDVFLTGSDQVWNLIWYNSAFFLDFVPSEKIKISYSASVAMDTLSDEQKVLIRNSLKDYKAVSVREPSAKSLLEGLSPVPVSVTLDPTLLLTAEDWDEVCTDKVVDGKYIFCYFLGANKKARRITQQFAQKRGLKIVAIPYVGGNVSFSERRFGDERLLDASPGQFLSLIKNAEYVFTDSFHAVVFSNIYKKQYFVFNRSQNGEMSSRIIDITELFGQSERFCVGVDKENLQYVESLSAIDYKRPNEEFERLRTQSMQFLKDNIGIVEE